MTKKQQKPSSHEVIAKYSAALATGMKPTQIYNLFKGTAYGLRKTVALELMRTINSVSLDTGRAARCIPQKYRPPPMKIYCYRDGLVDEMGRPYIGVNLYFIVEVPKNTEAATPKDFDYFEELRDWFADELEKSRYGASGMEYDQNALSECDFEEVTSTTVAEKDRREGFVFELGELGSQEFQYWGHFERGWRSIYVYREFDKRGLEYQLRRRF